MKTKIPGLQLNRLLVLATRLESNPNLALVLTLVQELVEAEFSRLMRQGVFSFGSVLEQAAN